MADGEISGGFQCIWQIGDPSATESGTLYLAEVMGLEQSTDQTFDSMRGAATAPVDVAGVGEEAYFDADTDVLGFRTDDIVLTLQGLVYPPLPDLQERLIVLAALRVSAGWRG